MNIFSAVGGIEKVCRVAGKGFTEVAANEEMNMQIFSLHDSQDDLDEKYMQPSNFKGFSNKKISFIKAACVQGKQSGIIVLSHINLLLVGFFIKLVSPSTKLVLFAHGIEVWAELSVFRKYMLKKCDLILPVSNYTKNVLQEKYHLPEAKFSVLNNCLDPFLPAPLSTKKDNYLMDKYDISKKDFVLITLTRLSSKEQYKGYDHVLFSINDLKKKYPYLKYIIMGKYDRREKKRLDRIISSLQIEDHIRFTGFVPDEELAGHFSIADTYVMPSKKEGFGIVFLEAMYYDVPVIAGNKDGSVDAVCNEKMGILVNPDSQKAITAAIEKMINNREAYLPDSHLLLNMFGYEAYKVKLSKIVKQLTQAVDN